ncbi:MAG: chemotaxis protein CheR, partial [Nitrospirae bacterium]|nr:chemotaxis protein CheR [Nitrospirota bacterium]
TGEKPNSMAITVLEAKSENDIRPETWEIKILGTDISKRALETAGSGIYDQYQFQENVPKDIISKYFLKGVDERKGTVKVKGFVQDMVRLRRLNFMESSYPFSKEFDVIMCRNVMIYFDEPMKQHVLSKFHRHLCNMGHLFLGHSETMIGNDNFAPVNVTVYRKK